MLDEPQIEEMMQRVRKLELRARRLVRESFGGEYLSSFRGQGLDFDDYREYQHGDEVRFIDWNVSARTDTPYVRKFHEERELSVILAVDVSGSADYGSVHWSKREIAAETAAILGFSALQNGDKVGLLLFASESLLYIQSEKGNRHLLRLIREILMARPKQPGTSFVKACDDLIHSIRRKSLVFLISDFHADEIDKPIGKLARKHETVALRIIDPLEQKLPRAGRVTLIDPESGHESVINTSNPNLRMGYRKLMKRRHEGTASVLRKHGVDLADIHTDGEPFSSLLTLLKRRTRNRSRN